MPDQLSSDLQSLRIPREQNPEARFAWLRWVALLAAVLVVLCGGGSLYVLFGARVFKTDVSVTEIRMVSPAQASIQVTSSGFVAARSESSVAAKISGRVAEVLIKEGQTVEKGQTLVRLEDADARLAIAAARARLAAAGARLQSAEATAAETRRSWERERGLLEKGAALRSTVDDLESRVRALDETCNAARSDAAAADAELSQLELTLQYLEVTAPISGTVVSRPVDIGELVGPASVASVAEIEDFTTLVVETDVPEARLGLVTKAGSAEIILDAFPTVRHRGRVAEISPKVNRAKATVLVRVEFVDPVEGVLPDMAARVGFLAGELGVDAVKEPPKLFVPASAIVERGGQKVVFRIDEGRARREAVTLGPPMAGGFELLSGPGDGTRLIADPPRTIDDGYPIREETP